MFDSLDPPSFMLQLVETFSLRERSAPASSRRAIASIAGVLLADGVPTYTDAGFTAEQVFAGGVHHRGG